MNSRPANRETRTANKPRTCVFEFPYFYRSRIEISQVRRKRRGELYVVWRMEQKKTVNDETRNRR